MRLARSKCIVILVPGVSGVQCRLNQWGGQRLVSVGAIKSSMLTITMDTSPAIKVTARSRIPVKLTGGYNSTSSGIPRAAKLSELLSVSKTLNYPRGTSKALSKPYSPKTGIDSTEILTDVREALLLGAVQLGFTGCP